MTHLRSEYLVVYDIENSKKRGKIFDRLKDFGLKGIQKSVFWGLLNKAEKNSLALELSEILGSSDDKVIFTPINIFENKNVLLIGHLGSDFEAKEYGTI
jgi:CRISPR-associated protein Cas2